MAWGLLLAKEPSAPSSLPVSIFDKERLIQIQTEIVMSPLSTPTTCWSESDSGESMSLFPTLSSADWRSPNDQALAAGLTAKRLRLFLLLPTK